MLNENAPIRLLDEVMVDGGKDSWHRAWPTAEIAANGDLIVVYKMGLDHHITDDGILYMARSTDGGITWPFKRAIAAEPGWDVFTNHGMTLLSDGSLLLHYIKGQHLKTDSGPVRTVHRPRRPVATTRPPTGLPLYQPKRPGILLRQGARTDRRPTHGPFLRHP
jgi:hypothetical protein